MSLATVMSLELGTNAVREGAVNVDLDGTVIVQIIVFSILVIALKPLLFDPMLKLFALREKKIDGAKADARHMDEESAQALSTYESAMATARAAAGTEREKLRVVGQKSENEILAGVRTSTAKTLETGRKETDAEATRVRGELGPQVKLLAADMASRALGREVRS